MVPSTGEQRSGPSNGLIILLNCSTGDSENRKYKTTAHFIKKNVLIRMVVIKLEDTVVGVEVAVLLRSAMRLALLVSSGSASTGETIRLDRTAKSHGCDGVTRNEL